MDKPNVLVICVDRWPGRHNAALENPVVLTPTLDQLGQSGIVYTNAYSTTPSCIPARRELHTGTLSPTHGDRVFNETLRMPDLPTLGQTFRDAGYQAYAVGKMHVYPQRDRIGFDDIVLSEDGRHHLGMRADDYELYLADQGYAGQAWAHGAGNNAPFMSRPWHLPEHVHPANWTVREMSKFINRRDPTRPALWLMSFGGPHPPYTPPAGYIDLYRDADIPMPYRGEWAENYDDLPYALKTRRHEPYPEMALREARRAAYASCTQIDHQMRLVVGMLREEGLLDNTIILVTSDHGEMMDVHGVFGHGDFYEDSARIIMTLTPTPASGVGHHVRDDRFAVLADVMPTLLELCDIPVPKEVEGLSLIGEERRDIVYGEHYENDRATRMIRDRRYKLVYYSVGNRSQLFDLDEDPDEMRDLAGDPALAEVSSRLRQLLVDRLYGSDLEWLQNGELVGLPDREWVPQPDSGLHGQRGLRFM